MTSPDLPAKFFPDSSEIELPTESHADLLHEAFDSLTEELDTQGNTDRFNQLRGDYAKKIFHFWSQKYAKFEKARQKGQLQSGNMFQDGDERLVFAASSIYEDEQPDILNIHRTTSLEEDDVTIIIDENRGLHMGFPPEIESKIREIPTDPPNTYYKIVFSNNLISTMTQTRIFANENGREVKSTRQIDCPLFGVEMP